jgi:hypothetical protein
MGAGGHLTAPSPSASAAVKRAHSVSIGARPCLAVCHAMNLLRAAALSGRSHSAGSPAT